MSSLGEELPKEIERVQEIIKIYEETPGGQIGAALMKADVREAMQAMISDDVVGMV